MPSNAACATSNSTRSNVMHAPATAVESAVRSASSWLKPRHASAWLAGYKAHKHDGRAGDTNRTRARNNTPDEDKSNQAGSDPSVGTDPLPAGAIADHATSATPQKEATKEMLEPRALSESIVSVRKLLTAECFLFGVLDARLLLQWMDVSACLAAESHCSCNAVTLSMDDLHFEKKMRSLTVGSVLHLESRCNQVFNTSMEVLVQVRAATGEFVCDAYFTFIALGADGKKRAVPPAIASSVSERCAAELASERKAWRIKRQVLEAEVEAQMRDAEAARVTATGDGETADATAGEGHAGEGNGGDGSEGGGRARPAGRVEQAVELDEGLGGFGGVSSPRLPHAVDSLSLDLAGQAGSGVLPLLCALFSRPRDDARSRPLPLAQLHTTQLVLPHHANHHGNTFGGQVMAWMVEAACIVAAQQTASLGEAVLPVVANVDALIFRQPSTVGDRVLLQTSVNRVFSSSMEVGVRVDRRKASTGELQHMNTGFLTLVVLDRRSGAPFRLPAAAPDAKDAEAVGRHARALTRRALRMQRRQMLSVRPDPISWSETLKDEICACNVYCLLRLAHAPEIEWRRAVDVSKDAPLPPQLQAASGLTRSPLAVSVAASLDTWGSGLWSLKVQCTLDASVERVLDHISHLELRMQWDVMLARGSLVEQIDEANAIVHMVFHPALPGHGMMDYVLLQSLRHEPSHGVYVLALRSVASPSFPTEPAASRGEILPSGYVLQASADGTRTRLTYLVQMRPQRLITRLNLDAYSLSRAASLFALRFITLQRRLNGDAPAPKPKNVNTQWCGCVPARSLTTIDML